VVGVEVVVAAADKCAISSWREDANLAVWCYQYFIMFNWKSADSDIDNCKNEHPSGQDNSQSQGGFGGNRFAPLSNNNNQGGARSRSGAFGSSTFVHLHNSIIVTHRATSSSSLPSLEKSLSSYHEPY
jgi:hypothetical protein